MRLITLTAILALATASAFAADQTPPPSKAVRGTITTVGSGTLAIAASDGEGIASGALIPKTLLFTVTPLKFDQLTSKDFVGVTAEPGKNGHLVAEEIHVLPGVIGEGQYPWDYHPGGGTTSSMSSMTNGMASMSTEPVRSDSMTNGMVSTGSAPIHSDSMTNGMAAPSAGNTLTVTYHGSQTIDGKCEGHAPKDLKTACTGTAIMDVPPGTPIVTLVPAKADDLKPGLTAVGRLATVGGKNVWGSVVVEKSGVKPEF